MSSKMQITHADSADAEGILSLQKLAFKRFPYFRDPQDQTIEEIRCEIAERIVLKGIIDDSIIASVRGHLKDGIGSIDRLIVHPDQQRNGFGRLMMGAIETALGGSERFALFTGSDNTESIGLYLSLGYVIVSTEPTVNGNELVQMEKVGEQGAQPDAFGAG